MSVKINSLVGDSWIEADTCSDDLSPSDCRETVARVGLASAADAARAMDAAGRASRAWRRFPAADREKILRAAAGLLRERAAEIALDIARDVGKTLAEATVEVGKSADFFDYYAAMVRSPYGDVLPDARPNTMTFNIREPLGVIVMITPWNDPLLTPARKIAPALSCGNTVVLKPARDSPLPAVHLVRALLDAGLPYGVVNLINGNAATVVPPMLEHPALAALSFTGSTPVGILLRQNLSGRSVRVQTEMGGKNASVVLADADLDLAVEVLVESAFRQAGQRCTATSRIIVQSDVHDEFVARLAGAAGALRIGPATAEATMMGPVINPGHEGMVLDHIARAQQAGGTVVTGGGHTAGPAFEHGCFVDPTLITGVTAQMPLWTEEVFGPVVAVRSIDTFDEAVAAVNDSSYGLAAGVFTTNLGQAHQFIAEVEVGQVAVNLPTSGWDVHIPFGGFKESGSPFKEQGTAAIQFYTRSKSASLRYTV